MAGGATSTTVGEPNDWKTVEPDDWQNVDSTTEQQQQQQQQQPKDTRANFGTFSKGPHKSFADTVGHDTFLGKTADFLGGVSRFLPSNESMIGAAAPATGVASFARSAGALKKLEGGAETATKGNTIQAIVDKIPKLNPVAKFLAKRIPGMGTTLDVLEAVKTKFGSEAVAKVESIPKATRSELAAKLYEETHGVKPTSAKQQVDAIREMTEQLRPAKAGKVAKEVLKPKAASAEVKADELIAKNTNAKEPLNARIGKQAPKQAPPGDLRRQLFSNLDDALGRKATPAENLKFRSVIAEKFGNRISAMSDEEIDKVIRAIPDLIQHLK
jgi:hypothetical protein